MFFFLMILPPPISTLFPYTTLFRSPNIDARGHARSKRFEAAAAHLGHGRTNLAVGEDVQPVALEMCGRDRKSTRLNSSHTVISYAVFCLKKKTRTAQQTTSR